MPAELNGSEVNGNAHLAQSSSICINKQYLRLAAPSLVTHARTHAQLEDSGVRRHLQPMKSTHKSDELSEMSPAFLQRVSCPFRNKAKKKKLKFLSSFVERWSGTAE